MDEALQEIDRQPIPPQDMECGTSPGFSGELPSSMNPTAEEPSSMKYEEL